MGPTHAENPGFSGATPTFKKGLKTWARAMTLTRGEKLWETPSSPECSKRGLREGLSDEERRGRRGVVWRPVDTIERNASSRRPFRCASLDAGGRGRLTF